MTDQFGGGKPGFKFGKDDLQLSDYELTLAAKILRPETMLQIDDRFIGYLAERLVLSGLNLPISQIQGFSGFVMQAATTIPTSQSTTSTSYTNLATTGPEITALVDGLYVVFYGAAASVDTAGGEVASMSIDLNGGGASDDNRCRTSSTFATSIFTFAFVSLDGGSNTITAKYKSSVGTTTASFADRKLSVLKYSNL